MTIMVMRYNAPVCMCISKCEHVSKQKLGECELVVFGDKLKKSSGDQGNSLLEIKEIVCRDLTYPDQNV